MKRTTFSSDIVSSGRFLSLPAEAQALYLQLSLAADDAGACDRATMLAGSYGPKALETLETAGFVVKIDDIYIVAHYIKNNTLRHLHISRSHYRDIISSELLLGDDGVYRLKKPAKPAEKPVVKQVKKSSSDATESSLAVIVIGYLNQKTGRSYKADTGAYVRLINARAKEGFGREDFFAVIDAKVEEWGNDAKMSQFLQPTTLFAPSHFDQYLQQAKKGKPASKFEAKTSDVAGTHGRELFGL